MSLQSPTEAAPTRQSTLMSNLSDDAVPETDPSSTAGLLAERLYAWRHAVEYLEEYMVAVEKIHKAQAKEYERVLKTISKPLKYGEHFDQSLGGVAGFFENMRANTQALVNTNAETEKNIKGSVLPVIDRLSKEIKHKSKELAQGAQKAAKEVEKARNLTQKHIELLGQNTAAFESTGGKMTPSDDPYVIQRGIVHRLHRQVLEENNHRNDLIAVQNNFQSFEAHIVEVIQQAMEAFNSFASGQAENSRLLYSDMLSAAQRIPPDFEWKGFVGRKGDVLVNPNEDPRNADTIQFPNMNHNSTKPLIEGSLERKSRNKLDWRYQTGYYVVTPSKFLHEFKDSDNLRKDPTPELSIYLPDAVIGKPVGEKFNVKGKDRSKTMSSKLTGTSELAFKAHTAADAEKWFDIIRRVAGATGPAQPSTPSPVMSPTSSTGFKEADAKEKPTIVTDHKAQEAGVTGTDTVASPTALSPTSITSPATKDGKGSLSTTGTTDTALTSPTAPTSATDEKKPVVAA